jgi:hypothetical protein
MGSADLRQLEGRALRGRRDWHSEVAAMNRLLGAPLKVRTAIE